MVSGLLVPTSGIAASSDGIDSVSGTVFNVGVIRAELESSKQEAREANQKRREAGAERKKLTAEAKAKKQELEESKRLGGKAAKAQKQQLQEARKAKLGAKEKAEREKLKATEAETKRREAKERKRQELEAKKKRREAGAERRRLETAKKELAKQTTRLEKRRQVTCAGGVMSPDGSFCHLSKVQYDKQIARVMPKFQTKEYKNQWGLSRIHAAKAYASVDLLQGKDAKPGAGAKVGILDRQIAVDHPAFAGQSVEAFGSPETSSDALKNSHGTAVASVIIARPDVWGANGASFPGVAWGADLKAFNRYTFDWLSPVADAAVSGAYETQAIHTPVDIHNRVYLEEADSARRYEEALSGVDFLNLSFGYQGLIDHYNKEDIARYFKHRLEAWRQTDREDKAILVWSAGNSFALRCWLVLKERGCRKDPNVISSTFGRLVADTVSLHSGIPLYFPELRGHTIAVVAVDGTGKISPFSNQCGHASSWCIAAPGSGVRVAGYARWLISPNGKVSEPFHVRREDGTSVAAPMVTGALAVMKGLFGDQLSHTDLVARLFATADKTGRYTDEKIYGQGLLDLGAAASPVGEPVIVVVGSVVGGGVPLAMTSLAPGKAFGDSLRRSFSGEGVVTFDALGAPFRHDLGSFVAQADGFSLQERLQTLMDSEDVLEEFEDPAYGLSAPVMTAGRRFFPGGRVSRTRNGREASGDVSSSGVSFGRVADKGHLSVAKGALMVSWEDGEGGLSATAFGTAEPSSTSTMRGYTTTPTGYPAGHADKPHTSGGVVAWQPSGAPIGLRAGWMTEQGSVLGASGRGAFGSLTGQTGFVGLHTGWKTDTWSVHANAEFGTIASTPEKSLIKDISGVITSTFGLSATRSFGAGRALQVSLSQPLRVESGRASFVVPVARTKSGSVVRRSFTSGLSPSGRQIDFSLSWHHRVSDRSRVHLSGILTHNPGHRANAKPEAALLLGWKHSF